MDWLRRDLIVSLRRLRQSPGFTAAAIATLALGIGANTTIFTAVNTIVFRALPVERPNELVALNTRTAKDEYPVQSLPNYRDFRDRNNVFSGLITYGIAPAALSQGSGNNSIVWTNLVSGNYFDVLGVGPFRGRVLHPEDDRNKGAHPVAVISYGCWQRRFGHDPDIAGKRVRLNGMPYTIVGVAPPEFHGTEVMYTPDIWVPMAMLPQIQPGRDSLDQRRDQSYFVIGRLKPGVTRPHAEAALNAIAAELGHEYPEANEGMKIALSTPGLFGNYFRGTTLGFAAVLVAVGGMVLLIACVNLAGLLLARAVDRRKETAIRLALGASPGQLIRQLLTESVVLSLAGGIAGILLAVWLVQLFAAWRPPVDVPVIPTLVIDRTVLLFAALASLATGLLFGLTPALASTHTSLTPALKNDVPVERMRRFHLRDVLVTAQVALSVVLLVGSILVVRSLQHALNLHLGFEPRHAASVSMDLSLEGYNETRGREFQRRLLEKVRSLPGVESAALINFLPLTLNISNNTIFIEGKPIPRAADVPTAGIYAVGPGYFHTAQTRLIAGRDFDERDQPKSKRVVIVNQAFAHQFLPNENPLGKRFRYNANDGEWNEIVGVVEDGKYRSLGEMPYPVVFRSWQEWESSTTVVARSSMPEPDLVRLLRRSVLELDPTVSISSAGSLTDSLGLVLFPARIAGTVLGAFGLLAVVLAATGVYGIMSYAVSRRTREIGIRVALGASSRQVLRAVLARIALLLAIGTAAGLALTLAAGPLFSGILYGVSPRDPATYALAIILMAVVAFAACWFPARTAIALDPLTALRTE
ncbi:MAG TPA: ABC transporter permease [Bryobacteraceae bacterium]|nr:ABC transporter permease [Bryobacteraceae bacterium]